MSKFNASISAIGIEEVKVQQALVRLLESSIYLRDTAEANRKSIEEEVRRLSQKISAVSEKIAWSHINVDLENRTFYMADIVSDALANYKLKVTFRNTTSDEISCLVNGTTVSLAGGAGECASNQTTVSGNGSFAIDNIAPSVDVFIRIWR